jgi:hypothetical protein
MLRGQILQRVILQVGFLERAMHKLLFVALLAACVVNIACLCGHL